MTPIAMAQNDIVDISDGAEGIEEVSSVLVQARTSGHRPAVLVLDIEHLPSINHLYGVTAGDRVMATVETRVSSETRSDDQLIRLGSQRFLLVVPSVCWVDDLAFVVDRLAYTIGQPISAEGHELHVAVRFGLAVAQEDDTAIDLVHRAESKLHNHSGTG